MCNEISLSLSRLSLDLLYYWSTILTHNYIGKFRRLKIKIMYPSSLEKTSSVFGTKTPPLEHYLTTPSSFLLPSPIYIPLEDEAVYSDFFRQQQLQFLSNDHDLNHHNNSIIDHLAYDGIMTNNNVEYSTMGECSNNHHHHEQVAMTDVEVENNSTSPPRKTKASKRDRHSKINTARGPRDRRMRLSLDVAKKLFGLQDLLGYDKASKTVDWLITKSKSAILDLLPDHQGCSFLGHVSNNSASSATSECEVLSGTGDHQETTTTNTTKNYKGKSSCSGISSNKRQKEKISKVRKCVDFHHPLAKETRQKARERARERTIVKRNNNNNTKQINVLVGGGGQDSKFIRPACLDQDVNRLGCWSPFEEIIQQPQCIGQLGSNIQGFVGDNSSMLMTNNWNHPSYFFNYQHQQHELNEFEITGKSSWGEGNNN